ncbi:F-box domain containing protein [Tanacetum coccineum]
MADHILPLITAEIMKMLSINLDSFSFVNGLLCFYGVRRDVAGETKMAVLWNPTIRKSVGIPIPNALSSPKGDTYIGFGSCPDIGDQVFVGGFIYWPAFESIKLGGRSNLIVSFGLKNDEFGEVCLPDRLVHACNIGVTKVYESLGLLEFFHEETYVSFCVVWGIEGELICIDSWYASVAIVSIALSIFLPPVYLVFAWTLERMVNHLLYDLIAIEADIDNESWFNMVSIISTNSIYTPLTLMAGHILHFHIEAEIRKGFRFKSLIRVRNRTNIGFGFALNTSDTSCWLDLIIYDSKTVDWEVEVYAWSARVWKSVSNIPPAFKYSYLESGQVYVGGFIYFGALDYRLLGKITSNLIVSFDLKSNEFGEVCLPDRLVNTYNLGVMKVYESLGLLEHNQYDDDILSCGVWVMKEGVSKMFTKMFSIKTPFNLFGYTVVELRKNGDAILKDGDYMFEDDIVPVLKVYETCSGHINDFGIKGKYFSFSVKSYMETLLLLDHSDSGHSLTMMQRMLGLYGHSPGVIFLMINMVIYAELMQDLNFSCVSQTKSCQIGPMID